MSLKQIKNVRPDSKGRIALGRLARGVSSYKITHDDQNRIILEPQVEIPAAEKWLFDNKIALKQVKAGLEDSAKGKTKSRGSFAQYLKENEE